MMTAALAAAGLEGTYDARDVAPPLTRVSLDALRREGVRGANVTVPHKEAALALADGASDTARRIGAANVLLAGDDGWRAENTDGPAFLDWIESIPAARACLPCSVVLGAGGAARAVVWALREAGAERVTVVNRGAARAEALARDFPGVVAAGMSAARADALEGALLVQCTSLGLRADDPLPLSEEALARVGCVLDLVYPATPLVRAARAAGIPAEDGLELLVTQGANAFALWTGREADPRVMREAALRELARRGH